MWNLIDVPPVQTTAPPVQTGVVTGQVNNLQIPGRIGSPVFKCWEDSLDASSGDDALTVRHVDMASDEAPSNVVHLWLIANSFDSIRVESRAAIKAGPSGGGLTAAQRREVQHRQSPVTRGSVKSGVSKCYHLHGINARRNYLFTGVVSKDGQYVYYDGDLNFVVKPGTRIVWFEKPTSNRIRYGDVLTKIQNLRVGSYQP